MKKYLLNLLGFMLSAASSCPTTFTVNPRERRASLMFSWLWRMINITVAQLCLVCILSVTYFSFRPCKIFLHFANLHFLSEYEITMESFDVKTLIPRATFYLSIINI